MCFGDSSDTLLESSTCSCCCFSALEVGEAVGSEIEGEEPVEEGFGSDREEATEADDVAGLGLAVEVAEVAAGVADAEADKTASDEASDARPTRGL